MSPVCQLEMTLPGGFPGGVGGDGSADERRGAVAAGSAARFGSETVDDEGGGAAAGAPKCASWKISLPACLTANDGKRRYECRDPLSASTSDIRAFTPLEGSAASTSAPASACGTIARSSAPPGGGRSFSINRVRKAKNASMLSSSEIRASAISDRILRKRPKTWSTTRWVDRTRSAVRYS